MKKLNTEQAILQIDKLFNELLESLGGEQEELTEIWWKFDKWAKKVIPNINLL